MTRFSILGLLQLLEEKASDMVGTVWENAFRTRVHWVEKDSETDEKKIPKRKSQDELLINL